MSLYSTTTAAKPSTRSLRATIPEGIVAYLDLIAGEKLEWKMESKDNERVAVVRRVRTN